MAVKNGDRIEFGSTIEPCGATVVSDQEEVVAIKWDSGDQSVTTVEFLATLAYGHETEPVLACGDAKPRTSSAVRVS